MGEASADEGYVQVVGDKQALDFGKAALSLAYLAQGFNYLAQFIGPSRQNGVMRAAYREAPSQENKPRTAHLEIALVPERGASSLTHTSFWDLKGFNSEKPFSYSASAGSRQPLLWADIEETSLLTGSLHYLDYNTPASLLLTNIIRGNPTFLKAQFVEACRNALINARNIVISKQSDSHQISALNRTLPEWRDLNGSAGLIERLKRQDTVFAWGLNWT